MGEGGSLCEFALAERRGEGYHYRQPFTFFESGSITTLQAIWNSAQVKDNWGYDAVATVWGDEDEIEADAEVPRGGGWES